VCTPVVREHESIMETKSTDCLASSGVSTAKNPLHGVNGGLFLPPCGPCGNAWHRSTQPLVVTTNTDVSVQRLLFQNLLLLGFDVDVKGGEYRVQFHEDMFKKANNKAMEVRLLIMERFWVPIVSLTNLKLLRYLYVGCVVLSVLQTLSR